MNNQQGFVLIFVMGYLLIFSALVISEWRQAQEAIVLSHAFEKWVDSD